VADLSAGGDLDRAIGVLQKQERAVVERRRRQSDRGQKK
jgi:hypothetical protein